MNRSKQVGMGKKTMVILLVGLALVSVHLAEAQQPKKVYRIGYSSQSAGSSPPEAFCKGCETLAMSRAKTLHRVSDADRERPTGARYRRRAGSSEGGYHCRGRHWSGHGAPREPLARFLSSWRKYRSCGDRTGRQHCAAWRKHNGFTSTARSWVENCWSCSRKSCLEALARGYPGT